MSSLRPLQKMISIIQSQYRPILPSSKSCTTYASFGRTLRALPRAFPMGRTNYVTTEGSAPCTTSIIENGNRSLLSNLEDANPILHRSNVFASDRAFRTQVLKRIAQNN